MARIAAHARMMTTKPGLKSEIYNFHRLDLTRQVFIVIDEDGLKLAATSPCSTPTEAFVEARKIVDNKIEGPRKKAPSRNVRYRGNMSAEMIIGSVLAAIILLRWLKWLRGDGENEEFDWLILALGVVAALTLAWRFLNPLGVHNAPAADGSPAHRVAPHASINAFSIKMREELTKGFCAAVERNNYFTGEPVRIPIEP
jgi:hypothetical protein